MSPLPLDIPDDRAYDADADEKLDETLAEAIGLAEEIDGYDDMVIGLEFLLAAHYDRTRE